MAMQQCPNGHLYDDERNSSCPYCSPINDVGVTVPLGAPEPVAEDKFPQTMPIDGNNFTPGTGVGEIPPTMEVKDEFKPTQYIDEAVNEVKGWLVCLEGSKRGKDFPIHGEKNTIGRGSENNIKLDFDDAISKGENATISYDARNNKFFIAPGNSKNNIYVNNQLLMMPVELKDYDVIELGNTKMIFRSLCNEAFNWPKKND